MQRSRIARRALAALALAACSLATLAQEPAAEPAKTPEKPSLLLITVEGWRRDHMSGQGYFRDTTPRLDRLLRESYVILNAWSPIAASAPAHASLFTATYSARHGLTALGPPKTPLETSDSLRSVFELLAAEGFTCVGFPALKTLAPPSVGAGLSFHEDPGEAPRDAAEVAKHATRWLELQGAKKRFCMWVNFKGGCEPNVPLLPFAQTYKSEPKLVESLERLGVTWDRFDLGFNKTLRVRMLFPELEGRVVVKGTQLPPVDRGAFERMYNRYDGDLRATDEAIGSLLDQLDRLALSANTIVVFAAVYGQALGENVELGHGELSPVMLSVPAAIRAPGLAPARCDELASLVDVLPTALSHSGIEAGAKLAAQGDGRDLLAPGAQHDAVLCERATKEQEKNSPGPQWCLYTPEWKYVHRPELTDQLFDLRADPGEQKNVINAHADQATALLERLRELRRQRSSK